MKADIFALGHAAPRAWLEDLLDAISKQEGIERRALAGGDTVGVPLPRIPADRHAFFEGASIAIQILTGYSELEELIPTTNPLWEALNSTWQEATE